MFRFALFALVAPAFFRPALSLADTCVTIRSHTDEYYYGGVVNPALDQTTELWIGGTAVAQVSGSRTYIMNPADSTLLIVNRGDSSYAEARLPFDWPQLVSAETASLLSTYRRHGEIAANGETRVIEGWNCRRYDVTTWIDVEDGRYDEREETVWVSTDPPVDWALYHATRRDALKLSNCDDELVDALSKIEGLRILVETKTYMRAFSVESSESVVRIEEKAPIQDVYSVPEGFRKKAELTPQDLRG